MKKNKKGIHYELKDRNIKIYKLKKGMGGCNTHTYAELALKYNLTRGRVAQIVKFVGEKYGEDLKKLKKE